MGTKHHGDENRSDDHTPDRRAVWVSLAILLIIIVINGGLGGFELYVFRIHEDSSSLFADGVHNLSDMWATVLAASGLAVSIAVRASASWTSGLRKGPTFTALLNFVLLIGLMLWATVQAVQRIQTPREFSGKTIFIVGTAAFVVNLISALLLHGHKDENQNMAAVFWHHAVDLMASAAVMLAGILYEYYGWTLVDPILTIGISVLVIVIGSRGAWTSLKELLEGTPKKIEEQRVIDFLEATFGEDRFHSLRFGGTGSDTEALVHVEIDLDQSFHDSLRCTVREELKKFGVNRADIVIDTLSTTCPDRGHRFGNHETHGWAALAHIGHSH